MLKPDGGSCRRGGVRPVAVAAVIVGLLGLSGCGDEDDEPERLNGGQGTITMVVGRGPETEPIAVVGTGALSPATPLDR